MEYLQEYVLKSNKKKVIISSIFEEYSDEIQKILNNLDSNVEVKSF
jgi:hypothetical protein